MVEWHEVVGRRQSQSRLTAIAFRVRRSPAAGFLVRHAFARVSDILPVRRVAESEHVLAFRHPVPGFAPVHVLLVPKLATPTLMHFTDDQRREVATEVTQLAPRIIESFGRASAGFLVVVNGGARQDVRQVHFHLLIDGYALPAAPAGAEPGVWSDVPDPAVEVHEARVGDEPLFNGLVRAAEAHDARQLETRGYSVVWDARHRPGDVVHVTAG